MQALKTPILLRTTNVIRHLGSVLPRRVLLALYYAVPAFRTLFLTLLSLYGSRYTVSPLFLYSLSLLTTKPQLQPLVWLNFSYNYLSTYWFLILFYTQHTLFLNRFSLIIKSFNIFYTIIL